MSDQQRVLAFCLDAADADLAFRWARAGNLPTLARLMENGASARLRSRSLSAFPDGAWWTLATGTGPGTHAHYNWQVVRPGTTEMVFAPRGSRRKPFWQIALETTGQRVLLLDPHRAEPLDSLRFTALMGWGQRSATHRDSSPPDLFSHTAKRYPPAPKWLNDETQRSVRSEERYFGVLADLIRRRTELYSEMMRERPWELCVASFSEAHNGAHIFHRYLTPGSLWYDPQHGLRHSDKLLRIYRLIDDAMGQLLAEAGEGTDVVVVSAQGMRLNTGGLWVLPAVLRGLGYQADAPDGGGGLFGAVRARVPWSVRRHVNHRLPLETKNRIMADLWSGAVDWPRTQAVAEPLFGSGFVRINLLGREPHGTVGPGSERDELCEEIARELRSLTDGAGRPVVAKVMRTGESFGGANVEELPDLVVTWTPDRIVSEVHHPHLGVIRERMETFAKSEHSDEGFLVAAGPRIVSREEVAAGHIVDIAPTMLALTGAPTPVDMEGQPLPGILSNAQRVSSGRQAFDWSNDPWAKVPNADGTTG